ncbi:phosphopyruvate hydratase [Streptacidiphilus sp. 4-A2]|nr:phosphopyruvate hydratase [Streptacidiphilus sp. 4-A2]
MPHQVTVVRAFEILDSRSRPTLSVTVGLAGGLVGHADVPGGTPIGTGEAVELRDGDPHRYGGQGTRTAVTHVNGEIADALHGQDFTDQSSIDQLLIDLDGTPAKARLGANALLGVSMAFARAAAAAARIPLWQHLNPPEVIPVLPVPHFTLIAGGARASNPLDFQEFMIAPYGAPTMAEALRCGSQVYTALRRILSAARYGTALGEESGFAPDLVQPEDALRLLVQAIDEAGYTPGRGGVAVALDAAATRLRQPDGRYRVCSQLLTSGDLIARYLQIAEDFPLASLEDGLGEDDHDGWVRLGRALDGRVQLVGDDAFVTDPARIARAAGEQIADTVLIKPNQIGTVTETLRAIRVCLESGYGAMVSHRSGETTDSFIADLSVGSGSGQIKSGAPAGGERVAKYNRLLQIEDRHPGLPYGLGL